MDILYIHPTKSLKDTKYSCIPVGVFALVNLLIQKGYKVEGINIGIENSIDDNYDLEQDLKNIDYKVLLIDLHWYEHSYGAIKAAEISKALYPDRLVIIGGYTTTIFAGEILERFECIDFAIKGDSEKPLSMLMDYLLLKTGDLDAIPNICYRNNESVIDKPITYCCDDMDALDFISNEFLRNNEFLYFTMPLGLKKVYKQFWLSIARGCAYNCTYCCGSRQNTKALFGREKIIRRTPEALANDIEKLLQKGVKVINPTHDFEMLGNAYYEKLFSLIRSKGIKPGLYLECFQLPSDEFLSEIFKTFDPKHTIIELSILSADEDVRYTNGKLFSNKEFFKTLDLLASNNIFIHIYYSLNLALDKKDSFEKTLYQIESILKSYPTTLFNIACRRVVLDPLAPMRGQKYNTASLLNSFMDYYNYCKSGDEEYIGYSDNFSSYLIKRTVQYEDFKKKMELQKKETKSNYIIT